MRGGFGVEASGSNCPLPILADQQAWVGAELGFAI